MNIIDRNPREVRSLVTPEDAAYLREAASSRQLRRHGYQVEVVAQPGETFDLGERSGMRAIRKRMDGGYEPVPASPRTVEVPEGRVGITIRQGGDTPFNTGPLLDRAKVGGRRGK